MYEIEIVTFFENGLYEIGIQCGMYGYESSRTQDSPLSIDQDSLPSSITIVTILATSYKVGYLYEFEIRTFKI